MKTNSLRHTLAASLLLLAVQPALRAAETNCPPVRPSLATNAVSTNKLTNAERRARIEAWRAERGGTNRTFRPTPAEDTRQLPAAERRARIRAKLAELRAKKMSGILTFQEQAQLNYLEAHQPPAPVTTNSPATNPPVAK